MNPSKRISMAQQVCEIIVLPGGEAIPILRIDRVTHKTQNCPFCGARHYHGAGTGHRITHCVSPVSEYFTISGLRVRREAGYILLVAD